MSRSSMDVQPPYPIEFGPSLLVPRHLVDLFFRPRRVFTSHLALGKMPYVAFVVWFYGAASPDRRLARLVMAYSAFVHAGPAVAAALISTAVFASYSAAFSSEEAYSVILLVFPFWSAAVSYTGVRSLFGVSGWSPRMWFLILPCLLHIVALGALAALVSIVAPEPAV